MYKLMNRSEMILRTTDGVNIPPDSNNKDYQVYLKWLDGCELQKTGPVQYDWVKTSAGNTPLPADE
jgi:hypothetical protein